MDKMMNVKEVAKFLGVSEATIYSEIKAGRIAYYRPNPNGKIWIKKEDLDDYLMRGRVEAERN